MRTETITLTPEKARSFLAVNSGKQRNVKPVWVDVIANDIVNGRWNPNVPNSALVFDENGNMIDGQHRCLAVIKADRPVETTACFGVSSDVFDLLDNNQSRTVRDYVKKYKTVIVPLVRFAVCIENKSNLLQATKGRLPGTAGKIDDYVVSKGQTKTPSRKQLLDYYYKNKSYLEDMAAVSASIYGTNDLCLANAKAWGCSFWLIDFISQVNTSKRDALYKEVMNGYIKDPALQKCVTTLMKMKRDRVEKKIAYTTADWMSVILATYDKYGTGRAFSPKDIRNAFEVWQKKIDAVRAINENVGDGHETN